MVLRRHSPQPEIMKCDNSSASPSFLGDDGQKIQTPEELQEMCSTEESSDTKDMQLIYNKKRRFNQQPNKLLPRSPAAPSSSGGVQCGGVEEDEDEDEEELNEDEGEFHKFRISSTHKSKLLLPPHLYKSFLANAFRQQHHHHGHPHKPPSSKDSPSNPLPSSSSSSAASFGGLHIFPRNLLFSCAGDRHSPTSSSSLCPQSCSRGKTEAFLRCSPPKEVPIEGVF